jgi:iron complex transport system substrate-binding protein
VRSQLDSIRSTRARRRVFAFAVFATSTLLLVGCASTPASDGDSDGSGADAPSGSSDAFPVTIESALGDAVIEAEPQRIVTIGWASADTAIALGTTPVGVESAIWGGNADQQFPWVADAVEAAGDDLPEVFNVYPEVDIEAILALEPDLVLAPQSGITAEDFATLSEIAPTVAYPGAPWATAWNDQIDIIGKALGKSEQATELISDIETQLANAAAANPEFADLSYAYVYAAVPGELAFYQAGDARVDVISGLGLTLDETVAATPVTEGTFTAVVGLEQADLLDNVDVLFTWFNDEANATEIENQPLFAQIPAVERGSYLPNVDNQLAMASGLVTPLSVPWALDKYVPMIKEAAGLVE